ncbi:MAG: FlgD immunoglobulin-like domain containing protein [candidate division Zixibacteria bacterium]|nr:FlgD immunoglobulin-like domain containing protein [candidate division Zixibacteria bacterium]
MRRNLLLVVLVFSMVLFFSRLGAANSITIAPPTPAALQIHPCTGGGTVQLDMSIVTTENNIVAVVVPIKVTGTAGAVLDTVLTGGLLDPNPPAFAAPSVVSAFTQRIVNPYGIGGYGLIEPMLFVAVDFGNGLALPTSGLFARMFYTVTGPGTVVIDTMTHSTGGGFGMNNPAGSTTATWGGPYTFNVTRKPIVGPTLTCPGLQDKFVNDIIVIPITATAGNTPIQGIITPTVPCGSGVLSGSIGNWTFTWNTAGCPGSSGILTFQVYDQCDTVSCDVPYKLTAAAGFIQIGNTLTDVNGGLADPCDLVKVPVLLKANVPFGGFDLYIEFDPTLLYFKGIEKGPGLPAGWEYFTYRQLPCPMCGCCKYKLQILGLYDIKDKHQGVPIPADTSYVVIAYLKFQVACDQNLRGYDLNICFEFDDGICTENTFSDVSGYVLYVSDNPAFFNYTDCDTQYHETNKVLNLINFSLFAPPGTLNPAGRPCGGVLIRTTAEKVRGDINLNLIAYEVGDAVLFSSYFIYGTGVFNIDQQVQIANTDINADGYPLSLSDFVRMLRILTGDATPIPKPTPGSDLATIYMIGDKVSTNANLGAALFVFEGDVKVSTDLKNEQGVVNNQTRVLVYMNSNTGMTGQLLTAKGELVSVEAADNFGRPVKTTVVNRAIPTAYALNANYPNPFNPTTNISFALPIDSKVSLKIYNVAGQLVRTLVNETMVAGTHTVTWDGINSNGEKVASGIYFYKLNAGDYSKTMKMVMTK